MAKDPRIDTGSRQRQLPPEAHIRMHFEKFSSFVEEYSSKLSLGGMFVITRDPRPVGSEVAFDLKLADGFRLVHGHGEVAWVRLQEGGPDRPPGMALRFIAIDEKGRELVLKVLEEQVKAGGQPFEVDPPPADAVVDYSGPPALAASPLEALPAVDFGEEPTLVGNRRRSLDETGFDAPWGQKLPEVPDDLLDENEPAPAVPSVSEVQFAPLAAPAQGRGARPAAAAAASGQTGLFDAAFPSYKSPGESPVDLGFVFEENPPAPAEAAGWAPGGELEDATISGHEDPLVDFEPAPGEMPFEPDPEDYALPAFGSEEPTLVGKAAPGAGKAAAGSEDSRSPTGHRTGTLASDGISLLPPPGTYPVSAPPEPWKAPPVPEWEVLGPEAALPGGSRPQPAPAPADPFAAPADPFAAPADPFAAPARRSAAPAAPVEAFPPPAAPADPFAPEGLFSTGDGYRPAPLEPFAPADPFAAPAPEGDAFRTAPSTFEPPRTVAPPAVEAYTPFDLGSAGAGSSFGGENYGEGFGLGGPGAAPGYPPPAGSFPPPAGGYPPPAGSFPPPAGAYPPPAAPGSMFGAGGFGGPGEGSADGYEPEEWAAEEPPPSRAARLKAALLSRKAILGLALTALLVVAAYFLAGDFLGGGGGGGDETPIAGGPPDGGGLPLRRPPPTAPVADGGAPAAASDAGVPTESGPAGAGEPERVVARPEPAEAEPRPIPATAAAEPPATPVQTAAAPRETRGAPSGAPAQFLLRIDVQKSPGRTQVELIFDGELDPGAVVRKPLGYRTADGLGKDQLILVGIEGSRAPNRTVGSPELAGVRCGKHPGELRVVFDLPPGARISSVTPEGKSLKVLLER